MPLNWDLSDDESASPVKTHQVAEPKEKKAKFKISSQKSVKPLKDKGEPLKSKKKEKSKNANHEPVAKQKFTREADIASAIESLPRDLPLERLAPAEKEVENAAEMTEEGEEPKKKRGRSDLTENKRKSLKYKARKKKAKIDQLRSTMPKEALEAYLNPAPPTETPDEASINYLKLWKKSRAAWKFNKLRQTWLLQNMYKVDMMEESTFSILLEYMEDLKGNARKTTLEQAEKVLAENEGEEEDDTVVEIGSRATRVLQILD